MNAGVSPVPPVQPEEFFGDVRQTFDRLDGEGPADHALFRGYLDLGPNRSLALLSGRVVVDRVRLQALAVRNAWAARAADFDADVTRRALLELEGEGTAMRKRHAQAARVVFEKAVAAAEICNPNFMQPRDIPVWLDVAAKLERASRGVGEAAKRVEITGAGGGPIEVAQGLSADDRRALMAAIQDQIAVRLATGQIEADVLDGEVVEDDPEHP